MMTSCFCNDPPTSDNGVRICAPTLQNLLFFRVPAFHAELPRNNKLILSGATNPRETQHALFTLSFPMSLYSSVTGGAFY